MLNNALYIIGFWSLFFLHISLLKNLPDFINFFPMGLMFSSSVAHRYNDTAGVITHIIWWVFLVIFHVEHASVLSVILISIIMIPLVRKVFARRSVYAYLGFFSLLLFVWIIADSIVRSEFFTFQPHHILISVLSAYLFYRMLISLEKTLGYKIS